MITSWKTWAIVLTVLAIAGIGWAVWGRGGVDQDDAEPTVRLPGEFEPPGALVLACHDANALTPWATLAQVIQAAPEELPIVLLVASQTDHLTAEAFLKQFNVAPGRVRLLRAGHGSPSIGRFGPLGVARRDGGPALVDTPRMPRRPVENEQAAFALAEGFKLPIVRVAMLTDGNVLSNGLGLALTTNRLKDINAEPGIGEGPLRDMLRRAYGIKQTVFLEPLEGESSGQVRMFAAFVSADTVVVGRYDPRVDPVNAGVLDRNAGRLAEVKVARGKKLKVVRLPMPPRSPGVWRTYTSVVFAGKVLMMPVHPGVDPRGQQEALRTYAKLLSDWRIVPLDVRSAAAHAGAPRCLVLPLGAIKPPARLPPPMWD